MRLWKYIRANWPTLTFAQRTEYVLGVSIAVFTALLVIISFCQREDFKSASEKELRPYLYISEFIDDSLYSKGKFDLTVDAWPSVIRFRISNSGQTPAYDVRVAGYALVRDSISRINPMPDPIGISTRSDKQVLPILPREAVPLYCEFKVDTVGFRRTMYVVGKITYDDTFGDSHGMTFCYQYILGNKRRVGNKTIADRDEFYPYPEEYNRETE